MSKDNNLVLVLTNTTRNSYRIKTNATTQAKLSNWEYIEFGETSSAVSGTSKVVNNLFISLFPCDKPTFRKIWAHFLSQLTVFNPFSDLKCLVFCWFDDHSGPLKQLKGFTYYPSYTLLNELFEKFPSMEYVSLKVFNCPGSKLNDSEEIVLKLDSHTASVYLHFHIVRNLKLFLSGLGLVDVVIRVEENILNSILLQYPGGTELVKTMIQTEVPGVVSIYNGTSDSPIILAPTATRDNELTFINSQAIKIKHKSCTCN